MSNVIVQKREQRMKAFVDGRAILDKAEKEGRDLTSEETQTVNRFFDEADGLMKEISTLERSKAIQTELEKPVDKPMVFSNENRAMKYFETPEYRASYLADFLRKGNLDAVYQEFGKEIRAGLDTTNGTEGGYLVVPASLSATYEKAATAENYMLQWATVRKINSSVNIPIVGAHASITWAGEEASTDTETTPVYATKSLGAHKAVATIKVSEEFVQDFGYDLETHIGEEMGVAFGDGLEATFVNGNGSSKPRGIVIDATSSAITTAGASTITVDNLKDLKYNAPAKYRKNGRYMVADSLLAVIAKLKDGASGTSGAYYLTPSVRESEPDTLCGNTIVGSTSMPSGAGSKAVIFGDFSKYHIGIRSPLAIEVLRELYKGSGQIGYRGVQRVDGKLVVTEAVRYLTMGS